ncbi:MAG: sensory histidine kinase AtoS [Candidatus Methanofastidiosum methylothiophilum]|uniref:histidine kinase n=1 Tax=Candidatus Methanofastidiosum methylothiophilum TaxID=1705564 RepID=A0A150IWU9_9EURY|nr:MAG: sensory histidine kinase AtoS [Candidatus Methanofastidiosum methylthiophilus]
MQFTVYQIPLFLSSIVSVILIGLLLKRKKSRVNTYLMLLLISIFIWSFTDLLNLFSTSLSEKIFWTNFTYFGSAILPVFWILFVLEYVGKGDVITRFRIILLSIIPIVSIILLWTNDYHQLMRESINLVTISGVLSTSKIYGYWFWVELAYNYLLMFLGMTMIYNSLSITHNIYRKQGIIFLVGILVPWASNFISVFNAIEFPTDMTSVSFSITAIVVFWGITRVQLLDIIPTAHQKFFGNIPDGVIILGGIKQVLDLNPTAESLLGIKISDSREKKLEELHIAWLEFLYIYNKHGKNKEYQGTISKEDKFYEISILGIYNKEDTFIGQLIILHNITKLKKMEIKIKDSNKQIEDLNETLQIMNKILRHDILNKLTVMKSSLWLYEEKNDKSSLDRLNRSIDSGIELIERIRELESFIMAKGALIPISIREIAEEVSNNINIPIKINGNATALADQALFSVFENIMRNAIIHGKTDKIDIDISSKNNICEIRIKDYGQGIPEFIKDNIFEEGLSYGNNKGSGLGLYIVNKTVNRYGGSIAVEDNKPQGAIFIIKLKCVKS